MTIELRTADGRFIGRIETETWQAPPVPAAPPKQNPNKQHGRKS